MATMPNELYREWNKFLEGEWTKDPPTKEGEYFLATLDGHQSGSMLVVYKAGDQLGFTTPGANSDRFSDVWGGYAWSVPMPKLSPVPQ